MNIGAFTLAPSMLIVNGHQDLDKWEESARIVFSMQRSAYWWVGDLVVYGEQRFGDDFYQAVDDKASLDLINRCVSVSREFPPTERNINLSWSHHKALQGMSKPIQKALLAKAESNGWTSSELTEHIARIKRVNK